MTSSILSRFVLPLALLVAVPAVPACGGGDGDSGGDGDGDGDGDDGTGSGGSGGDGDGDGDGFIDYGSGTASVEFNGTLMSFEAYQVNNFVNSFGLIVDLGSTDINSDDGMTLTINSPMVGTFDCTLLSVAHIVIQALNADGEISLFESNHAENCTITISEFGAVGEPVRGTFSGALGELGSSNKVPITNGTFDLIRGSDR